MAKSVIQTGKSLIKSKVFWFNILTGIVFVASFFGFAEFEPSKEVAEITATLGAIINIVLRFKTTQPITSIK